MTGVTPVHRHMAHSVLFCYFEKNIKFQRLSIVGCFYLFHNAPFRTEMCTFLFLMVHCGIWDRCTTRVVRLVYIGTTIMLHCFICARPVNEPCMNMTKVGQSQWRHNERDGVSNHQPHGCLLNCLFSRRSKKISKLRTTGLCVWNSPVTGEFPAQRSNNAENCFIWWRHHAMI